MMRIKPTSCRAAGLTLIELTISLAIMSMVAGAMFSITLAISNAWRTCELQQSVQQFSKQAGGQLRAMLSSAKTVGLCTADGVKLKADGNTEPAPALGAACAFWREDANNDGVIQLSEVCLIQHDLASSELCIYKYEPHAAGASNVCGNNDLIDSNKAEDFKKLPATRRSVLAHHVTGARFTAPGARVVEFIIDFEKDGVATTEYGTIPVLAHLGGP